MTIHFENEACSFSVYDLKQILLFFHSRFLMRCNTQWALHALYCPVSLLDSGVANILYSQYSSDGKHKDHMLVFSGVNVSLTIAVGQYLPGGQQHIVPSLFWTVSSGPIWFLLKPNTGKAEGCAPLFFSRWHAFLKTSFICLHPWSLFSWKA